MRWLHYMLKCIENELVLVLASQVQKGPGAPRQSANN